MLCLFLFASGRGWCRRALAHMRAFCYLLELTAGPNHPDLANGYHRMGKAYQDVGCGMMALRLYHAHSVVC